MITINKIKIYQRFNGAAVGVWFGGVGAVPGTIIGGFVGGLVGGYTGSNVGERSINYYHGR